MAKAGGGTYAYKWDNPATKQIGNKLSYAAELDKWQWMLGAGFIAVAINEMAATAQEIARSANHADTTARTVDSMAVECIGVAELTIKSIDRSVTEVEGAMSGAQQLDADTGNEGRPRHRGTRRTPARKSGPLQDLTSKDSKRRKRQNYGSQRSRATRVMAAA